ncbi:MAG TPA: TolC family protein [Gemmatimonadaceae bacterium]|nr:TolC family protein [Gemmatimonadaceae bacterium]
MTALAVIAPLLQAQRPGAPVPVTRAEAIAAALEHGPRFGLARADTAVAAAALLAARVWPDPTLSAGYSKSAPQFHTSLDIPLELPSLRRTRVSAATLGRTAAQYRFSFERAAASLDADTTYTRVLANLSRARLSRRNAQESDSLLRMVAARRDAGDASDLDVALATIAAGQQANVAAADSLTYLSSVLDLQVVMGLSAATVAVVPIDSLSAPPADAVPATTEGALPAIVGITSDDARDSVAAARVPLTVAAAQAALQSATLSARLQRRSVWQVPTVSVGAEWHDPSGAEAGVLPTVGLSLPLPILSRNRGAIAQAEAERIRAEAELGFATVTSRADIARTQRELAIATSRLARDRALVTAAERVAAMSLTAYREGASALPNVLEAQRNARDVLVQYVDDLASAWIFAAELRVLTLTPFTPPVR